MSADENKELVLRFFNERWNKSNFDIDDEIAPKLAAGGSKEWVRSVHASFGDFHVEILDIFADGDQVALHWRVSAVHQGDYLGVPATNKPVIYQGFAMQRIENGKIVDDVGYWDNLSILQQIGAKSIPDQDSPQ